MRKLFLVAIIGFVNLAMNAQTPDTKDAQTNMLFTIPNVSLLDIETTGTTSDIQFEMIAPTEAGDPSIFPDANTDHWLNYSFIPGRSQTPQEIKAKIDVKFSDDSSIPLGTIIQLSAVSPVKVMA